jgi:hypothetical protein
MVRTMPSSRLLIGGAAATAALGVRVARSLYGRWHVLPGPERERLAGVAENAKDKALAVRGTPEAQRAAAEADLFTASESLAAALVETAESDPEIGAEEVDALREDLRRELERLASADIKASRTARGPRTPPG